MHITATTNGTPANRRRLLRDSNSIAILQESIEDLQLHRLAGAVLSKSAADMAALSEANPELFWEWIDAFSLKKRQADPSAGCGRLPSRASQRQLIATGSTMVRTSPPPNSRRTARQSLEPSNFAGVAATRLTLSPQPQALF